MRSGTRTSLKFSIEYIRTFKGKDGVEDIEVEAIDTAEVMESPERLEKVADYILANHARKTHNGEFTAIMAVSNVKTLLAYYDLFKAKKEAGEHKLRIATIFSYQANEEDADADGTGTGDDLPDDSKPVNKHSRDALEACIADYNAAFGTNYNTRDSKLFYAYYKDLGKRVKAKEIDILLVVNMFLTGFDSKPLNTIYVDKNLKHHGLIQAYSRTNRTMGTKKSQGNVVAFRNLKPATDKAIELFANKDVQEEIILAPYEDYVQKFEEAVANLMAITPTVDSVDDLLTEEDEAKFVQAFREVIRIKNVMECFTQFDHDSLPMDAQLFADFRSKYLDLYDKVRGEKSKEKVSILDDLDFEVELISRDKINVSYILNLLRGLQDKKPEEQAKTRKTIMDVLDSEAQLRSKKELIERFIEQHFAHLAPTEDVGDAFDEYWSAEKTKALEALSDEEGLKREGLEQVLTDYHFTGKTPMRDDIIGILEQRPPLKKRKSVADRIIERITSFVATFIDGVD